jgi:hypothetical protein
MMMSQYPGIEFSAGLQRDLLKLTPLQRRAVHRIVAAEAVGDPPLTRLLKTPYSCRYCGWLAGQSSHGRDARKAMLAQHEATCKRKPNRWRFICNYTTYYVRWRDDANFHRCLELARQEVSIDALAAVSRGLTFGAVEGVDELRRQVHHGERDLDKRDASKFLITASGAKAPERSETMLKVDNVRQLDEDELDARAAALLARIGQARAGQDSDGEAAADGEPEH